MLQTACLLHSHQCACLTRARYRLRGKLRALDSPGGARSSQRGLRVGLGMPLALSGPGCGLQAMYTSLHCLPTL